MSKVRILKNTGIYTIALILPQIAGFFLLPVYTRWLTPADYAIISLVGSFTAIAGIFIALQLQSGIARYVLQFMAKDQKQEAKEILSSVLMVMVMVMLACFVLLEYFGDYLVKFTYPKSGLTYHPYFQLSLLTIMITALYQAPQAMFKALQMAKHFFTVSAMVLFSTIAFNIYFVVFKKMGIYGIFWGSVLGAAIGCVFSFWLIRNWLCKRFVWEYIPLAMAFSLPLIPHALGTYLFTGANRIILEKFVSLSDIGLFSIADRLASVPLLLVGAFNVAYNPYFIQAAEIDEKSAVETNSSIIGYWWVAVLTMVLAFVLFSDAILQIMSTKAYYASAGVASILVFSSLFRGLYMFAVSPLFFKKATILIPIITIVAGCVGIGLNIWAIPRWGIMGAAWATVAAYFMTFVMAEVVGRRVLQLKYPWKKMLIVSAIWLLIIVLVKISSPFVIGINYYLSWLLSGMGLLIFTILAAHVQNRGLTKLVFDKILRIPLNQLGIFAKEEAIAEDMGNRPN